MRHPIVSALLVPLAVLPFAARADFVIAERGRPADCAIVAEGTQPSLRYAAEELRDFTKRMTGVTLAVNPAVKPARTIELRIGDEPEDAFSLRVDGSRLRISGSVRGVLYGVYELLETYGGCAWFAPWCETVPEVATFAVPDTLAFADRPAILMREPLWKHTRVGDFAARLRMSGNSFSLREKHGGVSHLFSRRLPNCHTFRLLVPADKYFDAHPEYYSEVKGRRVRTQTQLCLTNPDVLQIVISNVLAAIAAEPQAKYFGVSQDDWENYCTCPKCTALNEANGSVAGSYITFVNAVAEAVEKVHPDKVIETLAYYFTRKPPTSVKPRHNVMVCLCTSGCECSRPLEEPGWPENAAFVRDIKGWSKICRNLYVWNYNIDTQDGPAPYPSFPSMQANFRLFRDCGATSVYEEGEYKGHHSDFAELKAYLTAKWLWNPDIPAEKLLTKFFAGYYGAAAPYVREYFEALNSLPRDSAKYPLDTSPKDWPEIVTAEFLLRAERLWKNALEAVKDDPVRAYNVRMGRMSVDYRLLSRDLKTVRMDSAGAASERTRRLAKRVQAAFDEAEKAGHRITISEHDARDADVRARIRAMAEGRLVGDGRRAFVQESQFRMSRYGSYQKFVDDPRATDGKALKLFDNYHNWYTLFDPETVAFDPGVRYRIRIRARFDRRPGATDDLPVLDCGLYNSVTKKYPAHKVWKVADFPRDGSYALMGDLEWVPAKGDIMFLMPGDFKKEGDDARNPALTGVYIDGLEITRVDAERHPWSHLDFKDDPQDFRFAIVPDRTGGDCRGAFTNALRCCNLMHPAFVMTVGDLINGHVDEPRTRAMQDELTNFVSKVEAPFFYMVGNHDITCNTDPKQPNDRTKHDMTTRVWKDYFGEQTYYSFTYKDCLFVVLNGQDGRVDWAHIGNDITPEQYDWLRKTLAEHAKVRWTFLFMHQPDIWGSKAWAQLEKEVLLKRHYTVFAGDWHNYFHVSRYGRDYYVLSVAGGCGSMAYRNKEDQAKLYGLEYGEFDHITWVTMTAKGPEVVNLKLDGILPGDFLNATNSKDAHHVRTRHFDIPPRKGTK